MPPVTNPELGPFHGSCMHNETGAHVVEGQDLKCLVGGMLL